jgi:hypothetical protein
LASGALGQWGFWLCEEKAFSHPQPTAEMMDGPSCGADSYDELTIYQSRSGLRNVDCHKFVAKRHKARVEYSRTDKPPVSGVDLP